MENSKWAKAVNSPAMQDLLLKQIPSLLKKLGNTPFANRAGKALELFKVAKSKGADLLTARNVIILGAALLYLLSPLDCIPDLIPVVGWLDDAGVLALAIGFVMARLNGSSNPEELAVAEAAEEIKQAKQVNGSVRDCVPPSFADEWQKLEDLCAAASTQVAVDEMEQWQASVQDPLRRVVFAGGFSAGKTSLLNALLRTPGLLKTSPLPCTPVLTTIMASGNGHPCAVWGLKDGNVEIWEDISQVGKFDEAMAQKAAQLTITYQSDLLDNGLVLVDTCGLESTMHNPLSFEDLPRSASFVFVKSVQVGSLTKEEHQFLNNVLEAVTGDQLIVVLNKTDLVTPEELEGMKAKLAMMLEERGIHGVKLFATCAKEGAANTCELEQLRRELISRAQISIPAKEEKMARERMEEREEREKARQTLLQLKAEERQRAMELAREVAEGRLQKLRETAEDAKDFLNKKMLDFVEVELMPRVCNKVNNGPMNEQTAAEVRELCRNELSSFLKGQTEILSGKLGAICEHSKMREALSATTDIRSVAPETHDMLVKKTGDYILPAISILGLLTMGTFSWLTTLAVPTLVLDKLGVGGKLADIVSEFGLGNKAREQFKESIYRELAESANKITGALCEMIDNSVSRQEEQLKLNCTL